MGAILARGLNSNRSSGRTDGSRIRLLLKLVRNSIRLLMAQAAQKAAVHSGMLSFKHTLRPGRIEPRAQRRPKPYPWLKYLGLRHELTLPRMVTRKALSQCYSSLHERNWLISLSRDALTC